MRLPAYFICNNCKCHIGYEDYNHDAGWCNDCFSIKVQPLKLKAKKFIDANVWDGEDRSSATNDRASFNPDELQELIDDLIEYLQEVK